MKSSLISLISGLRCPIVSYVSSFVVLLCMLYIIISYTTKTADYARVVKENALISRMQEVALYCKGSYSASLIAIKSNDPKRFVFKEVVVYNKALQEVRSAKMHNADYSKSYKIDNELFKIINSSETGEVNTPDTKQLIKSSSFRKISTISNSSIRNIALSVIKYENGNIRYVIVLSVLDQPNRQKCTKNDLVSKMDYILLGVDNGNYY
ncbi:MAG: hypothetical protein HWN81_15005 [Candidatus Lokiarchaeota archaeon]|nr:hypothetical protein [Candidatus Lokiarchaeota archaeon]